MSRPSLFKESSRYTKLSLKDRIRVLNQYKKTPCIRTLANEFKCSTIEVKAIHRRGKKKVIKEYVKNKTKKQLDVKYVQSETNPQVAELLENILYEWFQRAQRHKETGPITNEMLLLKADEAMQILPMKDYKINQDWVMQFRQKYDITDLDMTMLMLGNDKEALDMDMHEIAVYVVEKNPFFGGNSPERLSDLSDLDFEFGCTNENGRLRDQNWNGNSNVTRTLETEVEIPVITNDEEARRHLKPLEDYVLMKENYRAIGLIAQLDEIFQTSTSNDEYFH